MSHPSISLVSVALASCLALGSHASLAPGQPSRPPSDPATAPAVSAAGSWLALVDAGRYAESWDAAAPFFRGAVPRNAWVAQVGGVRGPLGAVRSRQLMGAQATASLPGAPPGSYVVIQYQTSFANRPAAVETVTPMLDPTGTWRVSGYFVR
jgi:hypothetical protein